MVEKCDKCGKPFMDKSEVNRHKMYEHSVPVSPFEESKEGALIHESINPQKKETGNRDDSSYPEELQKSIITTTTSNTSNNVDVTNKVDNNNNNSNYNNSKGINISQNRSRGFRSIRM